MVVTRHVEERCVLYCTGGARAMGTCSTVYSTVFNGLGLLEDNCEDYGSRKVRNVPNVACVSWRPSHTRRIT